MSWQGWVAGVSLEGMLRACLSVRITHMQPWPWPSFKKDGHVVAGGWSATSASSRLPHLPEQELAWGNIFAPTCSCSAQLPHAHALISLCPKENTGSTPSTKMGHLLGHPHSGGQQAWLPPLEHVVEPKLPAFWWSPFNHLICSMKGASPFLLF